MAAAAATVAATSMVEAALMVATVAATLMVAAALMVATVEATSMVAAALMVATVAARRRRKTCGKKCDDFSGNEPRLRLRLVPARKSGEGKEYINIEKNGEAAYASAQAREHAAHAVHAEH